MLSSRLHPSEVSIQHVQNLRDSCDIKDDINSTIAYKLTKRPCGTKPMPTREVSLDTKHGAKCNELVKNEDKFDLGKAKIRYSSDTTRYSYHDLNEFFRIECCAVTAKNCPCGYDHILGEKCYTL
uniref:Uncharacterized protein n=1 Tax=Panagrolaimus superbus TaxID=310955 RepID=A0A914YLP5_9BILA